MLVKRAFLGAVTTGALVAGGWLVLAGEGEPATVAAAPPPAAPAAPPVQVAEVVTRTLADGAGFTGRLEAVAHVDLRPKVGGHVAAVRFREGSLVRRGQVLFELGTRPLAAAVARARAQLHQAEAHLALAERKAARGQRLRGDDVIAQAELDTLEAERAESAAAVEAARASLRTATIALDDARVRAPIAGRVGQALVTEGNLVSGGGAGATLLTTIVSIDPLYVYFDLDEATFRRLTARGRAADGRLPPVPVEIRLADEPGAGRQARLDYLANRVDPSTGTARARAVLPNPDGALTAGLFARVRLPIGAPRPVVLVRDGAIATDQQGRFVLVVTAANQVEPRRVTLGDVVDGLRVVRDGLAPGDRVLVAGMARPGMTVAPTVVPMREGAP